MRRNRMKQSIDAGKPVIGLTLSIKDPYIAEALGRLDFDFVNIDFQHTPMTIQTYLELHIALTPTESTMLTRVPSNDPVWINRVLDAGSEGIIIPWVNTAEEAARAVDAAKYPPWGHLSWGPRRTELYADSSQDYALNANDNTLVLPQIETAQAVENLNEILSVEGVDGVMVGPNDLAFSMGYVADRNNAEVEAAIVKVLEGCKAHNKAFGIFTGSVEAARKWIDRGGLIAIGAGTMGLVMNSARSVKAAIDAYKREIE